jgi:transcriptional regulator with XRE-family HTH domain
MRTSQAIEVDQIVGRNIARRMQLLGMVPERLATRLELTGQTIHRVLSGQERLRADKLCDASKFLGLPIVAFFEDTA